MNSSDLLIESVMTPFPHSVGVEQDLSIAIAMMDKYEIRHLPVREDGEVVGILSDRDISFALGIDKKDANELLVKEAYTANPYVVNPEEKVKNVAEVMADEYMGCCLIMEGEELVGIFSTVDVCRCLADLL